MSKRAAVEQMIVKMSVLPIVSQILVKLNQAAGDERTSAEDLSKVIMRDQALTLRMLKVVNSSYYSKHGRERVTEISKAVVILGFDNVRRLALGLSVYDVLQKDQHLPAVQQIWSHALLTAITARQLAERTGYEPVEEAFVAGLVHDMGKLILLRCDPDTYCELLAEVEAANKAAQEAAAESPDKTPEKASRVVSLRQLERKVFGYSHVQAGRKLARRWGLPTELIETVAEHHVSEHKPLSKNTPQILQLAVAANHFTHLLEADPSGNSFTQDLVNSEQFFGIDGQRLDGMHHDIAREFSNTAGAFGLKDRLKPAEACNTPAPESRPEIDSEVMLRSLQDITIALAEARPTEQVIDLVLDRLVASVTIDRVLLFRAEKGGQQLAWAGGRGGISDDLESLPPIPIQENEGLLSRCIFDRQAMYVTSPKDAALSSADQRLLVLLRVRECAVVPLLFGDRPVGVLWIDNHNSGEALSAELRSAVASFGSSLALVLARESSTGVPA